MIRLIEGILLPLTGVGLMTLLTASYSRIPVTSHVLRTDASAPNTSILWYLEEALQSLNIILMTAEGQQQR